MLMHAAVNNTAGILASPASVNHPFSLRTTLVAWLTAALLWICALYFLVRMRRATLPHDGQALSDATEVASAGSI